jgi:hypothetical protein
VRKKRRIAERGENSKGKRAERSIDKKMMAAEGGVQSKKATRMR